MAKCYVYISGPITGVERAGEKFRKAAQDALVTLQDLTPHGQDLVIVNPWWIGSMLMGDSAQHDDYMRFSLAALQQCDCIVMMRGWEDSRGACAEHEMAMSIGLDIVYEADLVNPRCTMDL